MTNRLTVEPATVGWVKAHFPDSPKYALEKTVEVWKVKHDGVPVLVVGVIRHQLVGYSEMWVIVTEGFKWHFWPTLRSAKRLAAMAKEHYSGLAARTKPGADERFAEFFGFKRSGVEGDLVRWEL